MLDPNARTDCIDACRQCFQACLTCADDHCLEVGGDFVAPGHLRLMHDCADICHLATVFLLRRSAFQSRACAVCAEICRACAVDCEALGDDQMMRECAMTCRRCAEACRRMVAAQVTLASA
jgi:hypothetical protein